MRKATETLLRQWAVLQLLPRAPRKIDTATLRRMLGERGHGIGQRTLQRDLLALMRVFPLVCDDRSKPFGWSWMRDAPTFDLPGMDPQAALTFHLVGHHLRHLLPVSTARHLAPHVRRAAEVLGALTPPGLGEWPAKVRVVPQGLPLTPPEVSDAVLETVYDALLRERRFVASYQRRGHSEPRSYEVHPLGLVVRSGIFYLICCLGEHQDPRQLLLHRMRAAELLDVPRRPAPGFDLDAYVAAGHLGFLLHGEPVDLRLRVHPAFAVTLRETPLRPEQTLVEQPDGHWVLGARIPDTQQLRTWLLGHGPLVEVLGPPELRQWMGAELRRAAGAYGGRKGSGG